MNLVLHIGAHKTGSTALQQFFRDNRKVLMSRGVYYAAPRGALMANAIANALNVGKTTPVRDFLNEHVRMARDARAQTVLISAENFYGMSVLAALRSRTVTADPSEREYELIRGLRGLIPDDVAACQIVCYFRRPDRYAESLYNQQIKRDLFDGGFEEFLQLIEPILSYSTCISPWSDVFGRANCTVRTYEAIEDGIAADFMRNVLDIPNVYLPSDRRREMNERLSRHLLEFKRQTNRGAKQTDRDTEYRIVRTLERRMKLRELEPAYYQDFFSPRERADFLAHLAPEIDTLVADYDLTPFPAFDSGGESSKWQPYPGLASERLDEIRREYIVVRRNLNFRIERAVMGAGSIVTQVLPIARPVLSALKNAGVKDAVLRLTRGGRGEEVW